MSVYAPYVTSNSGGYSADHSGEHALDPDRQMLVWPTDKQSGPYVPYEETGPGRLWGYRGAKPPWPWNIVVNDDGTLWQGPEATLSRLNEGDLVLWGGHRYYVEVDSPLYDLLVAAGYEFVEVA